MKTLRRNKSMLLCLISLLFMAGMCEPDPEVDDAVLVKKVTLDEASVELKVGRTLTLTATVTPEDATNKELEWTSSDESVATVENGVVTAIGEGRTVVKAVANDGGGAEASCVVTVVAGSRPGGEVLSPTELKNKLESAGIEFVNTIKAETHNNLIEMAEYAVDAFEDFEIDEDYYEKLESLVEETGYEDYARRRNPAEAMIGLTRTCLGMAQNGAQLSTRAADVYTFAIRAGLNDLYGKFVPDYANNVWEWNSSVTDRIEVSFTDNQDQQWVAILKGSRETTRVHVTGKMKGTDKNNYIDGPDAGFSSSDTWTEEYEAVIDVPKQIDFTVKCNGSTVVDLTMNSSLAFELDFETEQEWTYDCYWYESEWNENGGWYEWYSEEWDGTFTLDVNYSNLNIDATMTVNGYEETFKTTVTKSGITVSAGVKIDGKSMLEANAVVNADMDAIIANMQEIMQDEDEEIKARNIKNVSMEFDVLGKVQVDASVPTFKNLYDAVRLLGEAEGIDLINNRVDEVNDAFSAELRVENTSTTQATFELEAREVNDDWGDSYIECYPTMVFASNGSRYAIEDYFTETAFEDLIDAVERLAEQFEDLYGDIDL